jgi:hypothetical protein
VYVSPPLRDIFEIKYKECTFNNNTVCSIKKAGQFYKNLNKALAIFGMNMNRIIFAIISMFTVALPGISEKVSYPLEEL